MKKTSIKTAILIPVAIILFIGVTLHNALSGYYSTVVADSLTAELIGEAVERGAYQLKARGDTAYTFATSSAPLVKRLRTHANGREQVVEAFEEIVAANDEIMGIWTVWEPGAFDGKDDRYKNISYHDETGRFIPYVYRHGGRTVVEPLNGYDDARHGGYYLGAKEGGSVHYTNPYKYQSGSGEISVFSISVPIWEDGRFLGVVGVDVDVEALNDEFNRITIMDEGRILTINPNGYAVTTPSSGRLFQHYSQWGEEYENLEKLIQEGGVEETTWYSSTFGQETVSRFQAVKIGDSEAYWVVCGVIPKTKVYEASRNVALVGILIGAIVVLVTGAAIFYIIGNNLRELPAVTAAANAIAQGRIAHGDIGEFEEEETKNEVALLRQAFGRMAKGIQKQVGVIGQIAKGDLTFDIEPRSDEDVLNIALKEMLQANNQVLYHMKQSADVVNAGSVQISDGSQLLAQVTVEQSASMEELASTVEEVAKRAADNEALAVSASRFTDSIREIADQGVGKLERMIRSVEEIDRATKGIESIIRVIDDIAFQTNILALNAAVEAARAGQEGKGFAVVADEVRNLAGKSAEAARDTGEMIGSTIHKTRAGVSLALELSDVLQEIADNIGQGQELLVQIPQSLQEQSTAIAQIETGIKQLADITVKNSITAEESATTSEELNSQAEMLRYMVSQYQLREEEYVPEFKFPEEEPKLGEAPKIGFLALEPDAKPAAEQPAPVRKAPDDKYAMGDYVAT